MSDPSIEEQVDAYCDPDQETPVRYRYRFGWLDDDYEPPLDADRGPLGHEEPCAMCGAMLWTFADADAFCRRCEKDL